mgnify:CR=1 FL=1
MSSSQGKDQVALIEISSAMERFVVLPSKGDSNYIIMIDDILRYCLNDIFNISGNNITKVISDARRLDIKTYPTPMLSE